MQTLLNLTNKDLKEDEWYQVWFDESEDTIIVGDRPEDYENYIKAGHVKNETSLNLDEIYEQVE